MSKTPTIPTTPKNASKKDFFISYTAANQQWAEWIAWTLEDAGYTTVIQAWDFLAGNNFVLEMHKALVGAERTIEVLSPAYLRAVFATPEWTAVFAQDPTGEQGLLLPVRIEECDLQGLHRAITYTDLVGRTKEEARAALLAGVSRIRAKPTTPPPFPSSSPEKTALSGCAPRRMECATPTQSHLHRPRAAAHTAARRVSGRSSSGAASAARTTRAGRRWEDAART